MIHTTSVGSTVTMSGTSITVGHQIGFNFKVDAEL